MLIKKSLSKNRKAEVHKSICRYIDILIVKQIKFKKMTTKNSKLSGSMIFPGMITVLIAVMLLFSCKKGTVESVTVKDDMVEAAKVLDGMILSGNVTTESNESEIALNCNNGNKFILIEKIQGAEPISINSIQSAEVITSKYGVILKDLSNNKIFLLTNNDAESLKMFEEVKSLFGKNLQCATVFGVTIVNAEKV